MPISSNNYTSPTWVNGGPPPIDASELQAITDTVENSQILHGSGAPTAETAGAIGQRYVDDSTTPPTVYRMLAKTGASYKWTQENAELEKLRYTQYAGNAMNVLDFAGLTTATSEGRKWTVNDDGSITVSGSPTGDSHFDIYYSLTEFPDWITTGKTYYVVFDDPDIYYDINYRKNGEWVSMTSISHTSKSFTVPGDGGVVGFAFRLWINYATHPETINKTFRIYTFDEMTNKVLTSQITNVTDARFNQLRYAQYAGNAKNVIDFAELASANSGGRRWTVNADRSITVSGNPNGNSQFSVYYSLTEFPEWITKGKTYYVIFDDPDIYYVVGYRKGGVWNDLISASYTSKSFTVPVDDEITGFVFRLWIDYAIHPETINKTIRIYAFDEMTNKELASHFTNITEANFNQLRYAQYAGNAKNILDDVAISSPQNSGGRRWIVNDDRSIRVSGTPSGVSIFTIYYSLTEFPEWITKGKTYYVIYSDSDISYSIGYRINNAWNNLMERSFTSGSFRVPIDDNITGFFIRLYIAIEDHPEAINKTIRFFVFDEKPNSVLATETGLGVRLPDYWQSYMDDKIQTIQQGDCNYHTGDSFVFSTDNHWEKNTKNSGALAQYIADNSSVKKIILGGDLITYHADKQMALNVINDVMTAFGGEPFVACGNHDDNGESTEVQGPEKLLILERYGTITRKFNTKIHPYRSGNNVYTYYTILNDADMFAYVVLDSTDYDYSTTQLNWLSAQLTALYQTYHIVIITHMHSASDGTVLENTGGKLETLLAGLSSAITDKIVAIFSGHIHRDRVFRTSTGIPIIITKCDTWQQEHDDDMVPGTVTEQVLDVVHIDLDSSTIYLTRIGSGQDRTVPFRETST